MHPELREHRHNGGDRHHKNSLACMASRYRVLNSRRASFTLWASAPSASIWASETPMTLSFWASATTSTVCCLGAAALETMAGAWPSSFITSILSSSTWSRCPRPWANSLDFFDTFLIVAVTPLSVAITFTFVDDFFIVGAAFSPFWECVRVVIRDEARSTRRTFLFWTPDWTLGERKEERDTMAHNATHHTLTYKKKAAKRNRQRCWSAPLTKHPRLDRRRSVEALSFCAVPTSFRQQQERALAVYKPRHQRRARSSAETPASLTTFLTELDFKTWTSLQFPNARTLKP